jgi:hypothetical protein
VGVDSNIEPLSEGQHADDGDIYLDVK